MTASASVAILPAGPGCLLESLKAQRATPTTAAIITTRMSISIIVASKPGESLCCVVAADAGAAAGAAVAGASVAPIGAAVAGASVAVFGASVATGAAVAAEATGGAVAGACSIAVDSNAPAFRTSCI